MLEVYGVVSVKIRVRRNAERVARPQRACRIRRVQTECVRVLAEAIDVRVRREAGLNAKVLRLKDEGVRRCGEENLFRTRPDDAERERGGCKVELNLRLRGGGTRVGGRAREDESGDLITG